jgi:anaerobic ribonucleoside-triphosphate reductase activating protein
MEIANFIECSLIEWPGELSSVIFTQGCNLNCHFCHNPDLIPQKQGLLDYNFVLDRLKSLKKRGLVDRVTFSGGEPTIQTDLMEVIQELKKIGFKVRLETNGTKADVIRALLGFNLVDSILLSLKPKASYYSERDRFGLLITFRSAKQYFDKFEFMMVESDDLYKNKLYWIDKDIRNKIKFIPLNRLEIYGNS